MPTRSWFPRARFFAVVPLCLIVACSAAASRVRYDAGRPTTSSTTSTLTAAEIQRASASNLYDAIAQIRPGFFSTRGSTSLLNEPGSPIVVIIDRHAVGGLAELRSIPVAITISVKRLNAAEVFQITGLSAPAGGVEIVLGR